MKSPVLLIFSSILFLLSACSKTDQKGKEISIDAVTPLKAKPNSLITVTGSGFSGLSDSAGTFKVYFGGIAGSGAVINDSLIEVYVPPTAQTGLVCIDYQGIRYCSELPFKVMPGNYQQNTFMKLPDYPGFYNRPGSMFSIHEDVYVGFDEFWRFSTDTYTWSRVAAMPYWSVRTAAFSINGKGYIFGGLTAMGDGTDRIWEYDPGENKWTEKTPMPAGKRFGSISFVYNNKAYIAGGEPAYNMPSTRQELWEYDPALDKWTRKANLPFGTELERNAYRLRNKFYVPGSAGLQEYDPDMDTWRVLYTGMDTRYRAVHYSARWQNITYIIDAFPFQVVHRLSMGADNETIVTNIMHWPVGTGEKVIDLYASVGEELFFIHVDSNKQLVEFWEYLPE